MAKKAARTTAEPASKGSVALTKPAAVLMDAVIPESTVTTIQRFLGNLSTFLNTAASLEQRARETLDVSKQFVEPQTGDEDAALQAHIKNASADKRDAVAHWDQITGLLFRTHRAFTGRRDVTTKMLDQAQDLPNRLHNAYVQKERARVEREQREAREAAEALERQKRQKELDLLEAQAIAAEATSADLSEREQAFLEAYLHGFGAQGDPVAAARRVGYRDPEKQAARLMAAKKIQAAISSRLEAARLRDQQQAIAEAPLDVEVETVASDVQKIGTDRTTWRADVTDVVALRNAVIAGQIPAEVLVPDMKVLNEYARSLKANLNRWPGVRAVSTTKLV